MYQNVDVTNLVQRAALEGSTAIKIVVLLTLHPLEALHMGASLGL